MRFCIPFGVDYWHILRHWCMPLGKVYARNVCHLSLFTPVVYAIRQEIHVFVYPLHVGFNPAALAGLSWGATWHRIPYPVNLSGQHPGGHWRGISRHPVSIGGGRPGVQGTTSGVHPFKVRGSRSNCTTISESGKVSNLRR